MDVTHSIDVGQSAQVRELLKRAAVILSQQLLGKLDPSRREQLEIGRAVVLDALRWLNDEADAGAVLTALDDHLFTRLNGEAGQCVERTRRICHEVMRTGAGWV
jgi:hypothetical protein